MADDPYRYFRLEAREILDQFGAGVLELEKGASVKQVQLLLRLAHTLKGAARVVRQPEIADGAHAIEDELTPFRDVAGQVPRGNIDAVLGHLDGIEARVGSLGMPIPATPPAAVPPPITQPLATPPSAKLPSAELPQAEPAPPAPSRPAMAEEPVRMVRAEIAEMDALIDGIAETRSLLGGLRTTTRSLEQVQRLADQIVEQLAPRPGAEPLPRGGNGDLTYALAGDLRRELGAIERGLASAVDQIDRELRQSREVAEQIRLVGAGMLVTMLERTARDAALALGKEIAFQSQGGDIRLDADVLATVQGAMVQLVRNAVAHGIETPVERRSAGKPAAGQIGVEIARRGATIVFLCRDDGRGIDLDAVRLAAFRRGMPAAEADRLDDRQLTRLLLSGGISTAATVTEIAGRGVGLDVVQTAVEKLGGTIDVATERGKGTTFTLAVPLSLASIEALQVGASETTSAAIPLDAVRRTVLLDATAVSRGAGEPTILYDGQAIPFLWLPRALGGAMLPAARKWPAVIIAAPAGLAAIGVDRLLGTRQIVLQPLPELAPTTAIIAAASLDAEGNPQLVLSPDGLVAAARQGGLAEPETDTARHPVLVVDDSLTTRMLEQSILESAGYEVDLAVSAEDALEIARQRRYALFLVDVDMPGMSGFDFVECIRADAALRDIPAILVTSRAAPEDRQRGRDAGAQGYIVKGEFDQAELLTMIQPLVAQSLAGRR